MKDLGPRLKSIPAGEVVPQALEGVVYVITYRNKDLG